MSRLSSTDFALNSSMSQPVIYLFGGSNGAGKTTFARAYLPNENPDARFLNADEIARGLSPFSPQTVALKAGRLMLEEVRGCIEARQSFGLESTLSGKTYIGLLAKARLAGYEIELHYLLLPNAALAVRRVRQRVRKGGHSVPEVDIRRRYQRSIDHLQSDYLPLADRWSIWDNEAAVPILLADSANDDIVRLREILRSL
jgi:predicted ABC-type ATPase